ncbi:MAG: sulfatase [Akkermansia sp.]|nr:sulfatase [Akkermansia sp.]
MKFNSFLTGIASLVLLGSAQGQDQRPNLLFIITDDHAVQALGSCDKDSPVPLPGFRRLASEGMVFDRAYCANSLCGPSRACMITGRHSHNNGFLFNEGDSRFNPDQPTYPQMLQAAGYQTGIIGKWHLVSQPKGFTSWQVFPGQGDYWNPTLQQLGPKGNTVHHRMRGYVTDVVTDMAIDWMENRDKDKPFALVVGHKAPHRNWIVAPRHLSLIRDYVAKLTPPANLHDDWKDRPDFLSLTRQSVGWDLCNWNDNHLIKDEIPFDVMKEIVPTGVLKNMVEKEGRFKGQVPADFDFAKHQPKFAPKTNYNWSPDGMEPGLRELYRNFYAERTRAFVKRFQAGEIKTQEDMTEQRWRWYMEDYLGVILAVDESIANLLDYLDKHALSENTLVIYVGDQGFYTGEHGLYDKRWIFEETFRMPLIMRWKGHIPAGVRSQAMVQEVDYAPTIVDVAGAATPENMKTFDGVSLTPLFKDGKAPEFEDRPLYYAFYEQPGEHNAPRHDGIRTKRYTLGHIWTPTQEERKAGVRKPSNEWMLFDNEKDPAQMHNVAQNPEYAKVMEDLLKIYNEERAKYRVPADSPGSENPRPKFDPSWNK